MRLEPHEPARFGRGSPVLRHWLANSTGFSVTGRHVHGVVEEVYGLPGATTSIAVRTRFRRRVVLAVDRVEAVVPDERLLIVSREEGARRTRRRQLLVRPVAAVSGRYARAGARWAGHGAPAAARHSGRAASLAARATARLAIAATRIAFRAARDATLTLIELGQAAEPHLRRLLLASELALARAANRLAVAAHDASARRRGPDQARTVGSVVGALGRDRANGNGHAPEQPARAPERRPKTTV